MSISDWNLHHNKWLMQVTYRFVRSVRFSIYCTCLVQGEKFVAFRLRVFSR